MNTRMLIIQSWNSMGDNCRTMKCIKKYLPYKNLYRDRMLVFVKGAIPEECNVGQPLFIERLRDPSDLTTLTGPPRGVSIVFNVIFFRLSFPSRYYSNDDCDILNGVFVSMCK